MYNLALVFGKVNGLTFFIVSNWLFQVDPKLDSPIAMMVSSSDSQNVTGRCGTFICPALLHSHNIDPKLFHLGIQEM